MTSLQARLLAVLNALNYDFRAFTLPDFVRHLEVHLQRSIIIKPLVFAPELHGLWVPGATTHYIFYNKQLPPFLREHTICHELAHLLLGHQPIRSDLAASVQAGELPVISPALARHIYNHLQHDPQEEEAEKLAQLLRTRVHQARQLPTSIQPLKGFANGVLGRSEHE